MNNLKIKILVIDDEQDILDFVTYNLKKEGFQVFQSRSAIEGIEIAIKEIPHLVFLDIMLPEMDGIEVCRELREIPSLLNSIIVFFTARTEDYSQIAGYEAGGDDYIIKPIKPKLLISKTLALLKRHQQMIVQDNIITLGDLTVDNERYIIRQKDKEISLARKEFELLSLLISKPNKVFYRDEIFSKIWQGKIQSGDRTIDVHIRRLRDKLALDNIKTIKGVGYKFEYHAI